MSLSCRQAFWEPRTHPFNRKINKSNKNDSCYILDYRKPALTEMVMFSVSLSMSAVRMWHSLHSGLDSVCLIWSLTTLMLAWVRSMLDCSWANDEFNWSSWLLVFKLSAHSNKQKHKNKPLISDHFKHSLQTFVFLTGFDLETNFN